MILDRRKFLTTLATASAAMALPRFPSVKPLAPGSFDFVFFTDTHIQPELDAAHGCDMCFRKIASTNPEFAIMGGDHVYDATAVNGVRAGMVFDLYKRTEQALAMPLHHAIGNHDIFGVMKQSGIAPTDPLYRKKCIRTASARLTTRLITRAITSSCSTRFSRLRTVCGKRA